MQQWMLQQQHHEQHKQHPQRQHLHHSAELTKFIEKGAENILVSKNTLYHLLEKAYLDQACPVCRRKTSTIFMDEYRSKGGACTFGFRCHGRGCTTFKEQLRTSAALLNEDGHRTRMSELPARMVYSFLIAAGLSFRNNYEEVLDLLGVQHFAQSQLKAAIYVDRLTTVVVNELFQEKLRSNRDHFKESSRHYVVVDGRWSCRGWLEGQ